jgi:acyl carrier protein
MRKGCSVLPDTIQRPISRTEIAQRVRGIIADALVTGPGSIREPLYLRVGLGISSAQHGVIVMLIESAFAVRLPEACTNEFWAVGTVGELCDLVEGAVRGGGIS